LLRRIIDVAVWESYHEASGALEDERKDMVTYEGSSLDTRKLPMGKAA
jgi:hypothetical protein